MLTVLSLAAVLLWGQAEQEFHELAVAPVFGDGRLLGCSINFKAAQHDVVTRSGGAVGFDGSANIYHFGEGKLGFALKATIVDGATREMRGPALTYLIHDLETNTADLAASEPADNAGYTMSMYRFGDATMEILTATIGSGTLTVGLQPAGSTMAHRAVFRLDVEQSAEWGRCYQRVLEDALAAMESD